MKWTILLFLIPTFALATVVPMEPFAQAKLETLLRGIPSAAQKSVKTKQGIRKQYLFPKTKNASFTIKCTADYYGEAPIPSEKACEVDVKAEKAPKGDEFQFNITDPATVAELRGAIPYGESIKKFYSHEQIYGQNFEGVYRNLFRFAVDCKDDSCQITFCTKPLL